MESISSGLALPTFLQDVSLDLTRLATAVAQYAEADLRRRRGETAARVTAAQVRALLAARHARTAAFGVDLSHPGWSILLELFRADLEKQSMSLARLAKRARVPTTTALRWLGHLSEAGLIHRCAYPDRPTGVMLGLTNAGREAMEDYFIAVLLGWCQA
jgi:DNA-binding MarR family transcriptional regulator